MLVQAASRAKLDHCLRASGTNQSARTVKSWFRDSLLSVLGVALKYARLLAPHLRDNRMNPGRWSGGGSWWCSNEIYMLTKQGCARSCGRIPLMPTAPARCHLACDTVLTCTRFFVSTSFCLCLGLCRQSWPSSPDIQQCGDQPQFLAACALRCGLGPNRSLGPSDDC